MNLQKQELPNREVELLIEVTPAELEPFEQKALSELAKNVRVKGFRQGKAPVNLVRQTIGEPLLLQKTLDLSVPHFYSESIKKEKITPMAYPVINVESVKPLVFKAVVALEPITKLKNLGKLKIKAESTKVTDKELDGAIYEFQKYTSTYKDVERKAQKGDRMEIDFNGFDESGEPLAGTSSKNHPLILGDGTFVPGFEENLIGLEVGDKKEFEVVFPKDYHKDDFKNKKVTFKIEVKRLEEVELAVVDKELSKKILGRELDEAEFRKELLADMQRHKEQKEQERQQAELFEKLLDHADIEISSMLYEDEIDFMLDQQKQEVERRGMNFDDYVKAMREAGRDLRKEQAEQAEKRVKIRYVVREIVKDKNLEATKDQIEQRAKDLNLPETPAENSREYARLQDELTLENLFGEFLEKPKN